MRTEVQREMDQVEGGRGFISRLVREGVGVMRTCRGCFEGSLSACGGCSGCSGGPSSLFFRVLSTSSVGLVFVCDMVIWVLNSVSGDGKANCD